MLKRHSISKSKKGFIEMPVMIIITVFVFSLLAIVGYQIFGELNTDVQASDLNTEAKLTSANMYARYPSTLDGAFLFMFILMWILLLVSLWFVDSNPLFVIIVVIIFVILLIAAGMLSNFWEDFSTDPDFDFASNFTATYFIMNNLLLVLTVVMFSGLFVMYMKNR